MAPAEGCARGVAAPGKHEAPCCARLPSASGRWSRPRGCSQPPFIVLKALSSERSHFAAAQQPRAAGPRPRPFTWAFVVEPTGVHPRPSRAAAGHLGMSQQLYTASANTVCAQSPGPASRSQGRVRVRERGGRVVGRAPGISLPTSGTADRHNGAHPHGPAPSSVRGPPAPRKPTVRRRSVRAGV